MNTPLLTILLLGAIAAFLVTRKYHASVISETSVTPLAAGAFSVQKTVEVGESGPTELHYVFFDAAQVEIKVIDQPQRQGAKLIPDVLRLSGAFAGCNGGYFHATGDFTPTGLQICDGTRTGILAAGDYVGSLVVKSDGPRLCWPNELLDDGTIQQLVQCNPWLIKSGIIFPSSEVDPRHRRTFVATDERGKWCIGCTSAIELSGLAALLADGQVIPELRIQRALNLDGGPSSGLWWRRANGEEGGVPQPNSPVRNFIALFPKVKP